MTAPSDTMSASSVPPPVPPSARPAQRRLLRQAAELVGLRQAAVDALLRIACAASGGREQLSDIRTIQEALELLNAESRPEPSDRKLVDAALQAGLCLPECWYLREVVDPEMVAFNARWVESADSDDERTFRLGIVDDSMEAGRHRIKQLRQFITFALQP